MFSYFQPVKRALDRSDIAGLEALTNSACKKVRNLLGAGYLRLRDVVVKRITVIQFGVNDGCGNAIQAVLKSA